MGRGGEFEPWEVSNAGAVLLAPVEEMLSRAGNDRFSCLEVQAFGWAVRREVGCSGMNDLGILSRP